MMTTRDKGTPLVKAEILLTPEGADRLREELEHLRRERRPRATAWLSETMGDRGDEDDTTDIESASSEFWFIEDRISRLEEILASAKILEAPEHTGVVQLGSQVVVIEGESEPEVYRIVSPAETDPARGFISDQSPLGRALINRSAGDLITIQSPDGPVEFRLLAVN